MGGIDNVDRQSSAKERMRKTMKWYQKFFFHLIDLCLSDAHALYRMRNEGVTSFLHFNLQVLRSLLKHKRDITIKSIIWTWEARGLTKIRHKFYLELAIFKVKDVCGNFFTIFFIFIAWNYIEMNQWKRSSNLFPSFLRNLKCHRMWDF